MKLLTKAIIKKLPPLYSTEGISVKDKTVVCKFFCPWGRYTFYVVEGDQEEDGDWTFFGFAVSALGADCDEWGYTSLYALESVKHFSGLGIERDKWFDPCLVSELKDIKC